ncbi:MAG: hypothetical protein IPQ07_36615 [Myxococcales bacterium]|nr:hypothetical protein [Myxococcales bacterium]
MRVGLLCSLLVACGFTAPGAPPARGLDPGPDARSVGSDGPSVLTPQAFVEKLVALECAQAFVCKPQYPTSSTTPFDIEWGTDLADCLLTDRDYLARDTIAAAVTVGRISFDPGSAAICLASPGIPSTCTTLFAEDYDFAEPCYLALAGHVPDGSGCTTGWECARTSQCFHGTCSRQ